MVAVLNRGSGPKAGHDPTPLRSVLYFGSFGDELKDIALRHPELIDPVIADGVPNFLELARSGRFAYIIMDQRDGRAAAQLLVPLAASFAKPCEVIVVTRLTEAGAYSLVPPNARVLNGALKESQLLRILGISLGAPQTSEPDNRARARVAHRRPPDVVIVTRRNLLAASVIMLCVAAMLAFRSPYLGLGGDTTMPVQPRQATPPVAAAAPTGQEEMSRRIERARIEVQQVNREMRDAQAALKPPLSRLQSKMGALLFQAEGLEAKVVAHERKRRSLLPASRGKNSLAVLREQAATGQISEAEFKRRAVDILANDEAISSLESIRQAAAQDATRARAAYESQQVIVAELARGSTKLTAKVPVELRDDVNQVLNSNRYLASLRIRLQNAEQNLSILLDKLNAP